LSITDDGFDDVVEDNDSVKDVDGAVTREKGEEGFH